MSLLSTIDALDALNKPKDSNKPEYSSKTEDSNEPGEASCKLNEANYYDVIFSDRVGNTAVHIQTGGRGGSEEATIRLAELLAARGYRVLVLTRDNFRAPDVAHWKGVDYRRALGKKQFSTLMCHALVNLRHSREAEGVYYEHYFEWVHDVPEEWCPHGHLPREDMNLVAVSQWQLGLFEANKPGGQWYLGPLGPSEDPSGIATNRSWKSATVIHPILPDFTTPTYEPVKHRFLYASQAMKGLVPTLELWRLLGPMLPADAELWITNPGYDLDSVPNDLRPNEKLIGILPDMAAVAELMRTCEGLFYVNVWPENFSQTVAIADAIGLKTHVLCTSSWAGVAGLAETAPHNLITTDRRQFVSQLITFMGVLWQSSKYTRATLGSVDQWIKLLRLKPWTKTSGDLMNQTAVKPSLISTIDVLHVANQPAKATIIQSDTRGAIEASWNPGMNGKLWPVWCARVPMAREQIRRNLIVRQMHPDNGSFEAISSDTWDLVEVYFDRTQFDLRKSGKVVRLVRTPDPTLEIYILSDHTIAVFESDVAARKYITIKKLHYATDLFQSYESLVLTDDDVLPYGCTWNDIFNQFGHCGLGVAQPALTSDSFYSHEITRQELGSEYRVTNFCESMCTLFTQKSFDRHVHNFDTKNGSNYWALDVAWSLLEGRVAILDSTPVRHHRAINNHYTAAERQSLWEGSRRFLANLGLSDQDMCDHESAVFSPKTFKRISKKENMYSSNVMDNSDVTPHFWKSIYGWFTFPDFYSWLAQQMPSKGHLVEVGTYTGQSAAFLAVELKNLRRECTLDLVDLSYDNNLPKVRRDLQPVSDIIGVYHQGCSWEVASLYEDRSLDAVFLDAGHSYDSLRKDIDAWLPKVKPGGILAGHDFTTEFQGVLQAVTETFDRWEIWRGISNGGDARMQGKFYPVWCVRAPVVYVPTKLLRSANEPLNLAANAFGDPNGPSLWAKIEDQISSTGEKK